MPGSLGAESTTRNTRAVVAGNAITIGASPTGPTPGPRLCRSRVNLRTARKSFPSSEAWSSAATWIGLTGCTVRLRAVNGSGRAKVIWVGSFVIFAPRVVAVSASPAGAGKASTANG